MLVKVSHQHTGFSPTSIFHQHPSPTLLQANSRVLETQWTSMMVTAIGETLMRLGASRALITKFLNNKISEIN